MHFDDKQINSHVNLLSSKLKRNVIQQAASQLLEHVKLNKNFHFLTQNCNTNAYDDYPFSSTHSQQNKKQLKRTEKCHSWLSKFPTKSDTSLNRPLLHEYESNAFASPIQVNYSNISIDENDYIPLYFHRKPMMAFNGNNDKNTQYESFSQPLILVHKKRLHRDQFLSTIQHSTQPPYCPKHFYALDQTNMLKLQRNLYVLNQENEYSHQNHYTNLKRKYIDINNDDKSPCYNSDVQLDRKLSSKKYSNSPKTADPIDISTYYNESQPPFISNAKPEIDSSIQNPQSDQSYIIVSHLEKILKLCEELRPLAKYIEHHLSEASTAKITLAIEDEKRQMELVETEQVTVDVYKEIDNQQITNEKSTPPPPYQFTDDTLSVHSDSNKSHTLMQTESFKTKSQSLTASNTNIRKSEDICSCFLKSVLEKQNCQLTSEEQEYLNELTKAYLLGKQHMLTEQENQDFQEIINEPFTEQQVPSNESFLFDTNNNNQPLTPISPSSILLYDNFQKSDDYLSSTQNDSTLLLAENDQQNSSTVISTKHQLFINESIGMKTTQVLPGIGTKYAQQLIECGFPTVRRLLGFYLMIKDDEQFINWLHDRVGISINSARSCTNALRIWCEVHL